MSRPLLFVFLFAFCLGIAAGEVWVVPMWAAAPLEAPISWLSRDFSEQLAIVVPLTGLAAVIFLGFRRVRWLGIVLIGLSLGIIRVQAQLRVEPNDISRYVGQTFTVSGVVVLPSTISGTAQKFELTNVAMKSQTFTGKLIVSVPAIPVVHSGSRVQVTCAITELTVISQKRLWSQGIHARCATQYVKTIGEVKSWRAKLGRWQEKILTYVRHNYNEPQASLLNGILIGNTDGMPQRLNAAFQATGTTHIVALSGFNVTIIMAIVVGWLIKIVGRRWAWIPALVLLIGFVVMSGASASVVRAAVMAVIVQIGLFIGRPISIGRLLAYTLLLMAWVNPLVIWHDLGCQLSFLATVGLVALSKPMQGKISWVTEKFGLRESLATTLSAIVMTEPLLLWRFGRISLVAPLVNVVVVPMIPLAMAIGSVTILGMWIPGVAVFTIPISDALLRLIIWCISFGASLPQAMIHLAPYVTAVCGALFVVCTIWLLQRNVQENYSA